METCTNEGGYESKVNHPADDPDLLQFVLLHLKNHVVTLRYFLELKIILLLRAEFFRIIFENLNYIYPMVGSLYIFINFRLKGVTLKYLAAIREVVLIGLF